MKILLSLFAVATVLVLTGSSVTAKHPGQVCDQYGCSPLSVTSAYDSWDLYRRRPMYRIDPWNQTYRPNPSYKQLAYPQPIYGSGIHGYRSYANPNYDYRRRYDCRPLYPYRY